jgi:hypothetical protein
MGKLNILKPRWLPHINFLLQNPFKKALFTSIWYNLNPLLIEKARRILIASKWATGGNVSSE